MDKNFYECPDVLAKAAKQSHDDKVESKSLS
jgi:hypothetical protein